MNLSVPSCGRTLAITFAMAMAMATAITFAPVNAQENAIDAMRSDAPALATYGKHSVGVRTLHIVNPGQLNIAGAASGKPLARYERELTVEVWYPAKPLPSAQKRGVYDVTTRDGTTLARLTGKAIRGALPDLDRAPYPLVIVSHGYPGNRFLLSHLAENLASKGYLVASIDHTDSTYTDQGAFGSTLLNRSLDQLFVLNTLDHLGSDAKSPMHGLVRADTTALIGYSMGGYGALNTIGAGLSAASVDLPFAPPERALSQRQSGDARYLKSLDSRIKAAVLFAPWGWNAGLWDAKGLAGITIPTFFIAGSLDDVSGYAPGVRNIFESSTHSPRYLLTFENANHNAGAPIPAPREVWGTLTKASANAQDHYTDAVWDNVRMNNIAQHFVTAFLGKYLLQDPAMDDYLSVREYAREGAWSTTDTGLRKSDHTYWKGFAQRSAVGLRLEHIAPL